MLGPSRYIVSCETDKCDLCEDCLSRCPSQAISIENGRIAHDTERCIGCGFCVTACPQEANRIILRKELPEIPKTREDLFNKMGQELLEGMVVRR